MNEGHTLGLNIPRKFGVEKRRETSFLIALDKNLTEAERATEVISVC